MITQIAGNDLGELVQNARAACRNGPVFNLVLEGRYGMTEFDSSFLRPYVPSAESWQAPTPGPSHYITHGQYIHRHGDGIAYLIDQLVHKPTGNRAVLSLIDMKDLIGSLDTDVRPSFMIFQVGFEEAKKDVIFVTLYFRALEVSKFLPSNLAEAGLILKKIRLHIPEIKAVHVVVHAFRAYEKPDSATLLRSELDSVDDATISGTVASLELRRIHAWLRSKMSDETVVETDALVLLRKEVESNPAFPKDLAGELEQAIFRLTELATLRRRASHVDAIADTKELSHQHIRKALSILEGMPQWK